MKTIQITIPDQLAAQMGTMLTTDQYENETEIICLALSAWLHDSQLKSGSAQTARPVTMPRKGKANAATESELGRQLRAIRQCIAASGDLLLDWDGVDREVADRHRLSSQSTELHSFAFAELQIESAG